MVFRTIWFTIFSNMYVMRVYYVLTSLTSPQTRKFFALSHEDKMTAKHPPESTPNRGYSYVGQESVSSISGYEKGLSQGKSIRDIKVCVHDTSKVKLVLTNNLRKPSTWAQRETTW